MGNFDYKKYLAEGKLLKENVPDNITSVVDDMTITMGEDAFIAAIFKALSLEDAKRILRVITNDNPIENALGPVTYDWLNENDQSANPQRLGPSSQFTFEPSDPKKDLMIHTIVDEYQDKIFDYLWNYELYRNEYLKENQGTQVTDHMWGRMSDDEKINALLSVSDDPDIAEKYYEYDWTELPSRYSTMIIYESKLGKENLEDIRLYIQKELGRAGEQDAGLDAYIDSIQRDFAAGRDAYDDYEMDDYLEDFENYIADKMDY